MRHEERDELRQDIYDLLTEEVNPNLRLTAMQKKSVRDAVVNFIEKRYHSD
jgi:hypothetical protein